MKKLLILLVTLLTFTSTAFAQIGSLAADLVFTPITPCRIVDTRISQGGTGPIATGTVKGFVVWGVSSYASQGGSPTNCGIVAGSNTAAVAVNFTAVSPIGQGYLTAFPGNVADAAKPLSATMSFNAGEVVVSNAATLKVAQASSPDLKVFSSTTTEVIIDVVGYYSKPISVGSLECTLVTATHSLAINFATYQFNTASCPATHPVVVSPYCYNLDNPSVYLTGSGASGANSSGGPFCGWRNVSGSIASVFQGQTCCRIPGR